MLYKAFAFISIKLYVRCAHHVHLVSHVHTHRSCNLEITKSLFLPYFCRYTELKTFEYLEWKRLFSFVLRHEVLKNFFVKTPQVIFYKISWKSKTSLGVVTPHFKRTTVLRDRGKILNRNNFREFGTKYPKVKFKFSSNWSTFSPD